MKKLLVFCLLVFVVFSGFAGGAKQSSAANTKEANLLFYYPLPFPFFDLLKVGIDAWQKDNPGIKLAVEIGPDAQTNSEIDKVNALVAAKNYNGIAIYALPGVNGFFEELTKRGINIVNYAGDSSTSNPKGQDTTASFYVGTDIWQAAYDNATVVIDVMGGKGTLLHILEVLTDPNTVIRQEAVMRACKDRGVTYKEVAGVETIDQATQKATDILSANPDAQGIVTFGMLSTQGLVSVLNGLNRKIYAVTADTEVPTLDAIRSGVIYGTVSENPTAMAYISLEILKQMADGAKPRSGKYTVSTGTVLVTKDNITSYEKDIQALTQKIKDSLLTEYLIK
ncbi:MAG: sugar ABC transporter substrate-binding protein [Treponema sp.]|jgi:ribose transport system substrate-binding protein|nr:sugar ABC transporter substrate-binding protein [Treponema sp.]